LLGTKSIELESWLGFLDVNVACRLGRLLGAKSLKLVSWLGSLDEDVASRLGMLLGTKLGENDGNIVGECEEFIAAHPKHDLGQLTLIFIHEQ